MGAGGAGWVSLCRVGHNRLVSAAMRGFGEERGRYEKQGCKRQKGRYFRVQTHREFRRRGTPEQFLLYETGWDFVSDQVGSVYLSVNGGGWMRGIAVLVFVLMTLGLQVATGQDAAARPEFYTTQVQPIFKSHCYRCHGGMNHRGGLNIQTRTGMMKGGRDGAVVVPGDPAKSLLLRLIRHEGPQRDPMPMPPKQPKLSDADIATVTRWIKAGAVMP